MARSSQSGGVGFAFRLLLAAAVVFSTYNAEGYSYIHWTFLPFRDVLPSFSILKALVGVVLLIGWTILLRATLRSLGAFGITLAAAFFGLLIWLVVDLLGLSTSNIRVLTYVIEIMLVGVLSAGVSWSHVRRRLTGQVDIDDGED